LNWFDSKVNESQVFSNSFQNTLSVKQLVESKFQHVDFSLFFENTSFSKKIKIKQPWIINWSGLTNSTTLDTHNQQQRFLCISLGFGDIKATCSIGLSNQIDYAEFLIN